MRSKTDTAIKMIKEGLQRDGGAVEVIGKLPMLLYARTAIQCSDGAFLAGKQVALSKLKGEGTVASRKVGGGSANSTKLCGTEKMSCRTVKLEQASSCRQKGLKRNRRSP